MRNKYLAAVEQDGMKKELPSFEIGDTVSVGVRIVEGNKERTQPFIGVVIGRRGGGINASFTVRRIVANEGVERTFPLHSPRISFIEVQRHGKTRRAKLYYLRERVGKARKLRERRGKAEGEVQEATVRPSMKAVAAEAREELATV